MDLFSWNETPAPEVQGPPTPPELTIAERGSLRLLKIKEGWTGGLVVEDIHSGARGRLAHCATWFNFNDTTGQTLNGSQVQTVKAWQKEAKA